MDKRILLLIAVFIAGSAVFFVYRKFFYQHAGISYEIRPGNMMIHVGDSISFQDKTADANRWKWDFGDGEYSAEQGGTHTYLQKGRYPIRLSVYGPFGMLYDERSVLEVLPGETVAASPEIVGSSSVNVNEPVRFESNTAAESYQWEITGEPGVSGKNEHGKTVAFSFTKPGLKVINLTLHNPDLVLKKEVTVNSVAVAETRPTAVAAPQPKPAAPHQSKPQKPKSQHDDLSDLESGGVEVKKK